MSTSFFNFEGNGSSSSTSSATAAPVDRSVRNSAGSGNESLFSFFGAPSHASTSSTQSQYSNYNDTRANLQRRFTTTNAPSSTMSALSPIGQQRRQAAEYSAPELGFAIRNFGGQRPDKKAAELEYIRQKRLQFENLQLEQAAQFQEAQNEIDRLKQEIRLREEQLSTLPRPTENQVQKATGNQSEPATQPPTPPEYRDSGFPTALSRPNRFSSSSIASPPGLPATLHRTNSQVTSPPSERARAYQALTGGGFPGPAISNKNSDEEDDSYEEDILGFNHRSAAALNRNSMPVTRRDHSGRNGFADLASLGHVNTAKFLFGDEPDHQNSESSSRNAPHQRNTFLEINFDDKGFPTLLGRDQELDRSQQNAPTHYQGEAQAVQSNGPAGPYGRASLGATSYPQIAGAFADNSSSYVKATVGTATPTKSTPSNRHSMGPRIGTYAERRRSGLATPPELPASAMNGNAAAPKLQSSYSTNDIPTVKSTGNPATTNFANANATAEQRLHNHNVSLGRIPAGAVNSNRHSRELSTASSSGKPDGNEHSFPTMQSVLQNASAPSSTQSAQTSIISGSLETSPTSMYSASTAFAPTTGYGLYGVHPSQLSHNAVNGVNGLHALTAAMGNLNTGSGGAYNPVTAQSYPHAFNNGFFPSFNMQQNRAPGQRRPTGGEDANRFANVELESMRGEIHGLCKDQHGCRFLQKKLEERKPEHIQLIFDETKHHMVELMTDPFGNYLCQKLLEHTTQDQRTVLINNAAPHMVKIALNQHGTRALQKMIEYVSTPEQINTVTFALKDQVVPMIQDLNGNHVIQKCLNHLSAADAQFIFDSVASTCVVVGTHRHGCCVIQRCIDHASGDQKAQLVAAITSCSYPLVQDPFGNYVLQYIFDQNDEAFSVPLCRTFLGSISSLSKQKFSSNVIEKCIRIADADTRHLMVLEIVNHPDFDRLADDSFANYVVQTAFDFATEEDQTLLADRIRPLLPRLRHKPYGRRFQTRISERDRRLGIETSSAPSTELSSPVSQPSQTASAFQSPTHSNIGGNSSVYGSPTYNLGNAFPAGNFSSPQQHHHHQIHRLSNPPTFPNMNSFAANFDTVQHQFGSFARGQHNGNNGNNNNNMPFY